MSIIQKKESFTTKTAKPSLGPQRVKKNPAFEGGIHVILPKNEHYQALSLFLVKYSVLSAC